MPSEPRNDRPIMQVEGLKKHFPVKRGFLRGGGAPIRALDGVSFELAPGETLGVVGESGCGKSTLGRTLLRIYEPTAGRILIEGQDIASMDAAALKAQRRSMQMIFQDPYASLDPRMTVGSIIGEPLLIHGMSDGAERRRRVAELMDMVELNPDFVNRYPHQFSGGQRQRIGIARALALEPRIVICDEPISALDVSIQAQIVNLLADLQQRLGLSYIFISHDLMMVRHIATRIAVMYLGKIAEMAPTDDLFRRPQHPYTKALLSAVCVPDPDNPDEEIALEGSPPSPAAPPSGCCFRTRCPSAFDRCAAEEPVIRERAPNHFVACHLP